MRNIFLIITTVYFCLLLQPVFAMELASLDDDSPLKTQYLQEISKKEEAQHLLSNEEPIINYTFFSEDQSQKNIICRDKKDNDEVNPHLPPELREKIVMDHLYRDPDTKKTLPRLHDLARIPGFLSPSSQRLIKEKTAFCHALYIIKKMNLYKETLGRTDLTDPDLTDQERTKIIRLQHRLRIKATQANHGDTFWRDLPSYSLWSVTPLAIRLNLVAELRKYIKKSKKYAKQLEDQCGKFPELLPIASLPLNTDETSNEVIGQNDRVIELIKKNYYLTRHQFLEDACYLDNKQRQEINEIFKKMIKLRHCTPICCCCIGTSLCTATFSATGAISIATGIMGIISFIAGGALCCACYKANDDEFHNKYFYDLYEQGTGIPHPTNYIQAARNDIKKLI